MNSDFEKKGLASFDQELVEIARLRRSLSY